MTDIKRMEKPTDFICEKCSKPMVIKWGRHGSFIACTGYPECNNPYLIEKFLKSGAFAQCPNAECKYKEALATEEVSA